MRGNQYKSNSYKKWQVMNRFTDQGFKTFEIPRWKEWTISIGLKFCLIDCHFSVWNMICNDFPLYFRSKLFISLNCISVDHHSRLLTAIYCKCLVAVLVARYSFSNVPFHWRMQRMWIEIGIPPIWPVTSQNNIYSALSCQYTLDQHLISRSIFSMNWYRKACV